MKILGGIVAVVLLLVVGVFVYVGYNTDSIVKRAIETIGPQYLGARVSVGSVDISLKDGRGTLKNLEIGNPPGFDGPYALRIGTVSMSLDVARSNSSLVVLDRVTIDGAQVAAIAKSPTQTNLQALASNVPESNASPLKMIIGRLDLTHTRAAISSPLLTQSLDVDVPDVHLKDIGRYRRRR